jgi:serine/threonine protein kinase
MSGQTFKSDIWSLGCTVLELLSGHPPYWDVDPMRAMFCIVQDGTPPIPESLPQEVKDFLLRCFVKDTAKRASAQELLEMPWITQNAHLVSLAGAKLDYNSVVGTLSKVYGKKKSIKSSKSKKVTKKKVRDLQGSSPSGSDMSPATSSFDLSTTDVSVADSVSPSESSSSIAPPEEPFLVPIHSLSITHSDPHYVPPQQHDQQLEPVVPVPEPEPAPTPEDPPAAEPVHSADLISNEVPETTEVSSETSDPLPIESTPPSSNQSEPEATVSSHQSRIVAVVGVAIVGFVLAAAFVLSRRMR